MEEDGDTVRVSEDVKRELDRRRRDGETVDDVLRRVLDGVPERVDEDGEEDGDEADFFDGFGSWSDEHAERVREWRREAKAKSKERMRRLQDDG